MKIQEEKAFRVFSTPRDLSADFLPTVPTPILYQDPKSIYMTDQTIKPKLQASQRMLPEDSP